MIELSASKVATPPSSLGEEGDCSTPYETKSKIRQKDGGTHE